MFCIWCWCSIKTLLTEPQRLKCDKFDNEEHLDCARGLKWGILKCAAVGFLIVFNQVKELLVWNLRAGDLRMESVIDRPTDWMNLKHCELETETKRSVSVIEWISIIGMNVNWRHLTEKSVPVINHCWLNLEISINVNLGYFFLLPLKIDIRETWFGNSKRHKRPSHPKWGTGRKSKR